MATEIEYKISKLLDKDLIQKVLQFASAVGSTKIVCELGPRQIEVSLNSSTNDALDPFIAGVSELGGCYINKLHVMIQHGSIIFMREEVFDKIVANTSQHTESNLDAVLRIYQSLNQYFPRIVSEKIVSDFFGKDVAQFYEHRDATLARLEQLSEKLIRDNEAYRLAVDKKKEEFEALLVKTYEEKQAKLAERHKQLDEKEAAMELADAKSSRRKLRHDLLAQLKQSKITAEGGDGRWPIHLLFISLSILLFLLGYILVASPNFDPTASAQAIKLGLLSIGLAGTLTVYYRWMDAWNRLKVDETLRLRQLSIDVDRASWVVEMLSENKSDSESIPDAVVAAITRNMFSGRKNSPGVSHPAEDMLSALLRSSSKIELDLPGGKVSTTGKAISKEAKTQQTGA